MKAVTDTQHYDNIAKAINYSKNGMQYKSELVIVKSENARLKNPQLNADGIIDLSIWDIDGEGGKYPK